MTHEEHLRRITEAPLAGALRARLQAGLEGAFQDHLSALRGLGRLGASPEKERELKRAWDGKRRALQAAFAERLREIEGGT